MADEEDYWALPTESNAKEGDLVPEVVEDDDPDLRPPFQDTLEDDHGQHTQGLRPTEDVLVQPWHGRKRGVRRGRGRMGGLVAGKARWSF